MALACHSSALLVSASLTVRLRLSPKIIFSLPIFTFYPHLCTLLVLAHLSTFLAFSDPCLSRLFISEFSVLQALPRPRGAQRLPISQPSFNLPESTKIPIRQSILILAQAAGQYRILFCLPSPLHLPILYCRAPSFESSAPMSPTHSRFSRRFPTPASPAAPVPTQSPSPSAVPFGSFSQAVLDRSVDPTVTNISVAPAIISCESLPPLLPHNWSPRFVPYPPLSPMLPHKWLSPRDRVNLSCRSRRIVCSRRRASTSRSGRSPRSS